MSHATSSPPALVTGASGQDGFLLAERLANEGFAVHALVRSADRVVVSDLGRIDGVTLHQVDIRDGRALAETVARVRPVELYNLAGLSSVSESYARPDEAWLTNAAAVEAILEAVRVASPETRMYQASTSEMFGWAPKGSVIHDESSVLMPQSPYAASKAAAHLLCGTYRRGFGLRIACGILFNHESRRRGPSFLSRKVTDHVNSLRRHPSPLDCPSLVAGNLKVRRDWGFAPDYVDGMCRILRQVAVRAEVAQRAPERDNAGAYRDYVLGTGQSHAVWELIDRAFALAGFRLDWDLSGEDPDSWCAVFGGTSVIAVRVDPSLLRLNDPLVIESDPRRACRELGWAPRIGLDPFLEDMLSPSAD